MNTTINNYKVKIIRKKNKHTYIRVKNNEIVITTNYLTPKILINKLIKNNSKEIEQMIINNNKKINDNNFYLLGNKYDVIYDELITKTTINNDKLIVKNELELTKFLDQYIKIIFSSRLNKWYSILKKEIPVPNLKIRKMKSRWGVCNTKNNNVTLNYYLYKYDLECLDYVIVHELSHFIVGNHSKDFWKIVNKYYPNYKEVKKKLRS